MKVIAVGLASVMLILVSFELKVDACQKKPDDKKPDIICPSRCYRCSQYIYGPYEKNQGHYRKICRQYCKHYWDWAHYNQQYKYECESTDGHLEGWREVLDQPFQPRGSTDCTRCGNIFEKSGMENCVWEPYSDWSECSVSCGGGTKTRTRVAVTEVVKKLAEFGFRQCLDNGVYVDVEETETATCNDNSCPRPSDSFTIGGIPYEMKEYGTLCSVDTAIDNLDLCEAVNAYANNNEEHFLEETYSWENFPSPIRSVENANLPKGCYYSKERFTRGNVSYYSIFQYKILFNKVERTNFISDSSCQYAGCSAQYMSDNLSDGDNNLRPICRIRDDSELPENCKDELPEDWVPNARYFQNITCSAFNCTELAEKNLCHMDFSQAPISNCLMRTTGLVRNFCRRSCKSCVYDCQWSAWTSTSCRSNRREWRDGGWRNSREGVITKTRRKLVHEENGGKCDDQAVFHVDACYEHARKNGGSVDCQDCCTVGVHGLSASCRSCPDYSYKCYSWGCVKNGDCSWCGCNASPINCLWNDYSAWSECNKDCGGGTKHRTRTVYQAAQFGGEPCEGGEKEEVACNENPCAACNGWKQTANCDPNGPREPHLDKDCFQTIDSGWSGFCECSKNVVGKGCESWVYENCNQACEWAEEPKPKECGLACSDRQHVTCLACLNDVTPHEYCEKYQRTKGCKAPKPKSKTKPAPNTDQLCSDCPGCLTPEGKCWEYNPKMAKVDSKGNSMTRKQFSEGCIKNGGIDCSETNLGWSCERNRRCAKDNMNVAKSDCSIGSKDEIEWISANSLVKCQNWAENKCNATIAVYWPENWCEGYTTSCKYGEEAYNVNSIVHFCKKEWSCERNRRCAKDNMNVARSDCSIGSKDEIEWISANSLEKCQNWAENKCNATIAVYWPENWCEGYTTSCKYGEEAYNVNSIVHFCKKGHDDCQDDEIGLKTLAKNLAKQHDDIPADIIHQLNCRIVATNCGKGCDEGGDAQDRKHCAAFRKHCKMSCSLCFHNI